MGFEVGFLCNYLPLNLEQIHDFPHSILIHAPTTLLLGVSFNSHNRAILLLVILDGDLILGLGHIGLDVIQSKGLGHICESNRANCLEVPAFSPEGQEEPRRSSLYTDSVVSHPLK